MTPISTSFYYSGMAQKPEHVSIKIPRRTYEAAKALAKKRGCFIGRILADAFTFYVAYNPSKPESPEKAA